MRIQRMIGMSTVRIADTKNMRMALAGKKMAQSRVARYMPTNITIAKIAAICLNFFMEVTSIESFVNLLYHKSIAHAVVLMTESTKAENCNKIKQYVTSIER